MNTETTLNTDELMAQFMSLTGEYTRSVSTKDRHLVLRARTVEKLKEHLKLALDDNHEARQYDFVRKHANGKLTIRMYVVNKALDFVRTVDEANAQTSVDLLVTLVNAGRFDEQLLAADQATKASRAKV